MTIYGGVGTNMRFKRLLIILRGILVWFILSVFTYEQLNLGLSHVQGRSRLSQDRVSGHLSWEQARGFAPRSSCRLKIEVATTAHLILSWLCDCMIYFQLQQFPPLLQHERYLHLHRIERISEIITYLLLLLKYSLIQMLFILLLGSIDIRLPRL